MLQKLDFTETDGSSSSEALSKKELSAEELNKQLEKLVTEDKANDEQIFDWVEVHALFPLSFYQLEPLLSSEMMGLDL